MRHDHLFAFEHEFVESLRCVPMAVRIKLDRAGIKLSLRQWSRFTRDDRRELLATPCETAAAALGYRERLIELVMLRSNEIATPLPEPVCPIWNNADGPPEAVTTFSLSRGVQAPSDSAWRSLDELQRFVLVKLSRDNHDNVNFVPAMREFGLF